MFPPVLAIGFIEVVIILIVVGFTLANWIRKAMQALNQTNARNKTRAAQGDQLEIVDTPDTPESTTDLEAMAARRREQLRLASGGAKSQPQRRAEAVSASVPQRAQREAEQRRIEKMRGTEGMAAAERERAAQTQRATQAAHARAKQADRAVRAAKTSEDHARREQAKTDMASSVLGLETHATTEAAPQAQRGAKTPAGAVAATASAPATRGTSPTLAVLRGMSLRDAIVVREILDPPLSLRPARQRH